MNTVCKKTKFTQFAQKIQKFKNFQHVKSNDLMQYDTLCTENQCIQIQTNIILKLVFCLVKVYSKFDNIGIDSPWIFQNSKMFKWGKMKKYFYKAYIVCKLLCKTNFCNIRNLSDTFPNLTNFAKKKLLNWYDFVLFQITDSWSKEKDAPMPFLAYWNPKFLQI